MIFQIIDSVAWVVKSFPVLISIGVLTLFIESKAYGTASFEIVGGGLTDHVTDNGGSQFYSYKVSSDGRLIANPLYGAALTLYSRTGAYFSLKGFKGMNSIAQPINGGIISAGHAYRHFQIGVVVGGYIQNNNDFAGTRIIPYSVGQGSNAFVPIIGLELNLKIILSQTFFLRLINVISPIITNSSASFGIDF